MNVAATEMSKSGLRSHGPVPLQAPVQPVNTELGSSTGSRCTGTSRETANQHVARQSPCRREVRTAPGPETATVTVALVVE